jgi:hypothetical protein
MRLPEEAGSKAVGVAACTPPATARARMYEDNIISINENAMSWI